MSSIAPILERSTDRIRFEVDDVTPALDRLPTVSAREQFERVLTTPLLSFSHADSLEVITDALHAADLHPLVLAIHQAFSQHRPLLLTPNIIWLTIAQGFAQHVNNNAESLRSNFVSHQGKERLVAEVLEIPTTSTEWTATIEQWTLLIRDNVGADVYRLLECNFSTTTPITRTASHVVMMDAFQKYFDYVVMCVCGIPEISLLGTVEDWQSIYDRVRALARYDLDWWVDRLLPICQEFVNTAQGYPDRDFWQCIYKPKPVYGAELMTGWLADLFPYIKTASTGIISTRNPLLAIESCDWPPNSQHWPQGVSLTALPSGISQANFKVKKDNLTDRDLELVAGFVGVTQDPEFALETVPNPILEVE